MRFWLLAAALFGVACTGCSDSGANSAAEKSGTITLALNWFPEAEHGGYYAALVHGYYEEAGLQVIIRPGGPGAPVVSEVATGKATFGVSNADQILIARAQEADVVALMAPIQDSPRCIMVHEESGISRLEELKNVTLAMSAGRPFALFLRKHTDLSGVQIVPYNGGVSEFLRGPKHAQQAYSFSEPFTARQHGAKPRCLMVSELGFNPYTSVLFSDRQTVDGQSEMVSRFVAASIRGWEKYLQDPRETNEYIHSINPEMSLEVLDFGVSALRPLCRTPEAGFGAMDHARWKTLAEQLVDVGLLRPAEADVSRVMWSSAQAGAAK